MVSAHIIVGRYNILFTKITSIVRYPNEHMFDAHYHMITVINNSLITEHSTHHVPEHDSFRRSFIALRLSSFCAVQVTFPLPHIILKCWPPPSKEALHLKISVTRHRDHVILWDLEMIQLSWNAIPCYWASRFWQFEESWCFHPHGQAWTPKVKAL